VLGFSAWSEASEELERVIPYSKGDGTAQSLIGVSKDKVYTYTPTETAIHTWSSSNDGDISFAFYKDEVYIADGVNDMISWDGSTITTYTRGSAPTFDGPDVGQILGIWNSRMYFSPASDGMRIEISRLGVFDKWDEDDHFSISVNSDGQAITGGIVSEGKLIVTTQDNLLEVYSSVGANRIGDTSIGCVSRKSLRAINGVVFGMSKNGIFEYNNLSTIMATKMVDPLFVDEDPVLTSSAGEYFRDRYLCSFQRGTENDITLDVYPRNDNAVMRNDYPMFDCTVSDIAGEEDLYFIDARDRTKIRKGFDTGSFLTADDGTSEISCHYETAHYNLGSELQLKRLYRMRVIGSGDLFVSLKLNYSEDKKGRRSLDFSNSSGAKWDSGLWGSGKWGGSGPVWDVAIWDQSLWSGYALEEKVARITSRARTFSFFFDETSGQAGVGRSILDRTSKQIGSASLYIVEPRYVTTGRTR
jgi:hypothetical protein